MHKMTILTNDDIFSMLCCSDYVAGPLRTAALTVQSRDGTSQDVHRIK